MDFKQTLLWKLKIKKKKKNQKALIVKELDSRITQDLESLLLTIIFIVVIIL